MELQTKLYNIKKGYLPLEEYIQLIRTTNNEHVAIE